MPKTISVILELQPGDQEKDNVMFSEVQEDPWANTGRAVQSGQVPQTDTECFIFAVGQDSSRHYTNIIFRNRKNK